MIEEKMNALRSSSLAKSINWSRIDRLIDFGGIRIEDNIVCYEGEVLNLTRLAIK